MKHLTSIVAMNHQGAIGARNTLPWRLRSDLRFFRATTLDHVVIMGRLTYESLGRKPLPGRKNVVLSHSYNLFNDSTDCVLAFGIEEGLLRAEQAAGRSRECYIIGGASMYEQFAPYVDRYLITLVDKDVPNADTFVRESLFGDPDEWALREISRHAADEHNEAAFTVLELKSLCSDQISAHREQAIQERARRGQRAAPLSRQSRMVPSEYGPSAALL